MTVPDTTTTHDGSDRPLLAGLDLLTERERHADELAFASAAALAGGGGRDITVGTHWARLGERRHVALVVEVSGLEPAAVTELLSGVTDPAVHQESGLLVGLEFRGPAGLLPVLSEAVRAQRRRASGRAVVFPGSDELSGTTTVGSVTAATSIDRVEVIGAGEADRATLLVTRSFLRPLWIDGRLVLHVQPAAGGTVVPFESPDPTPCCAAHS